MLKGVNRQVVEIPQPESKYFEKILLFVKPECSRFTEQHLLLQAKAALPGEVSPPQNKNSRRRLRLGDVLRAAGYAGAGAGLMALLQLLLR